MRKNKYNNKPTTVDGVWFASKFEASRWCELRLLEQMGKITNLRKQVTFPLEVGGVKVTSYRADFVYDECGKQVVEDAKGYVTPEYKIKRSLMLAVHGIKIREVRNVSKRRKK